MRRLSETIARLAAVRAGSAPGTAPPPPGRLTELVGFGSNPGALKALTYLPKRPCQGLPLVVVLHGCTQSAAGYDHGTGWSQLAERAGFALLFPEQQRANNPNLCFNWFVPDDIRRDRGEALSIRQMIGCMVETHGLDPQRVFVTGLSAGAAMASVMLATYPELFAGGALIAGLAHGVAASVPEALERMAGCGIPSQTALQRALRDASAHQGRWPTISVWHGSQDRTVVPANGDAIIAQWRGVHGVPVAPTHVTEVAGYPQRSWRDADGAVKIAEYSITGMGHGTPIGQGDGLGNGGPFILPTQISSTREIARDWRLIDGEMSFRASRPANDDAGRPPGQGGGWAAAGGRAHGVGKVIEDALRSAGLMR